MAVTGTKEIDFNIAIHIKTIKFEEKMWHKKILPLLTKLYFGIQVTSNF